MNIQCKECGNVLMQKEGKRTKSFCGSTCRSNFWQKAKRKKMSENEPAHEKQKTDKRPLQPQRNAISKPVQNKPETTAQVDSLALLRQYEAELLTVPDVGIGKKRRKWLLHKIEDIKNSTE